MKKLTLNVEKIEVESFNTDSAATDPRGTVLAHATFRCSQNPDNTCFEDTCQDVYTCGFLSCGACGTYKC
ncbi:MAG TPA: hypothetical protein VGC13_25420 [Longimicrobium sp.]|jgi:hypothetical protein|uniref:hypothetical protein n=1 Tax=Longimicrobium sp. TaxID=2029185 RepID=UPI002ED79C32